MIQNSKIFPIVLVFALFIGLSACSSSQQAGIDIAENLGATTGLPEVKLKVEDLTASHRQIRDRFGALETLYIDLRKSSQEESAMVDEVKILMTENKSLKREILAMNTRLQKSETLADRLIDRVSALENGGGQKQKTSQNSPAHDGGAKNSSSMIESSTDKQLFSVHLASFRETSQITSGWSALKEKFPHALGGLNAKVETSTLPQLGSFLRLLAGPFVSMSEAKTLCDTLQLENQYCKPAPFFGEFIE